MKITISFLIILLTPLISNCFVYNINVTTNEKNEEIKIEWYGPTNYLEGSLFYNVYYSTNVPKLKNNKIVNIYDFELLSTLEYKTNNTIFSVNSKVSNNNYVIIPITNGVYIYNYIQNTVPKIQIEEGIIEKLPVTNLTYTPTNITTTNLQSYNISTQKEHEENEELKSIVLNLFLKKKYKLALEKLKQLRELSNEKEEKVYIDMYIARCYYALNKKRKAIYILLNLETDNENLKSLINFWLDRYSRYFFK